MKDWIARQFKIVDRFPGRVHRVLRLLIYPNATTSACLLTTSFSGAVHETLMREINVVSLDLWRRLESNWSYDGEPKPVSVNGTTGKWYNLAGL